jgi:hypothetical protein
MMQCQYEKCPKLDDEWVHKDQGSYHEACLNEEYSEEAFYWAGQISHMRASVTTEDLEAYEPGSVKWLDVKNRLG